MSTKHCAAVAVAMMLLLMGACTTPRPGMTNRFGAIRGNVEASPARVVEVAEQVLTEQGLVIVSAASSEAEGEVVARTKQDERVYVNVERVSRGLSKITLRVGILGDEAVSMSLHDKITRRLNGPSDAG